METTETSGSTLTLDAFSTGKGSLTSLSTLTISHIVASQSERILIVGISRDKGSPVHDGQNIVKYDGQALTFLLTKAGDSGTDASVHIYYLLDPPTGTNDITVQNNTATTTAYVVGAASLYGVNADTPFGTSVGATGTDGTPTVTVVTASGEFILAVVALANDDSLTAGTNETERWDDIQGDSLTGAGYTQAGSDGGVMAPSHLFGVTFGDAQAGGQAFGDDAGPRAHEGGVLDCGEHLPAALVT
ncbi:hypothetical protein LCGC14_2009130 [marine sediment metagenome]|uniref:Uncharacterized protein n=1 Tax=marine sediment metagenome TaxID=412755 RepID=A0A0F9HE61_9ZZZZ